MHIAAAVQLPVFLSTDQFQTGDLGKTMKSEAGRLYFLETVAGWEIKLHATTDGVYESVRRVAKKASPSSMPKTKRILYIHGISAIGGAERDLLRLLVSLTGNSFSRLSFARPMGRWLITEQLKVPVYPSRLPPGASWEYLLCCIILAHRNLH
jgi:hypothetical protein